MSEITHASGVKEVRKQKDECMQRVFNAVSEVVWPVATLPDGTIGWWVARSCSGGDGARSPTFVVHQVSLIDKVKASPTYRRAVIIDKDVDPQTKKGKGKPETQKYYLVYARDFYRLAGKRDGKQD